MGAGVFHCSKLYNSFTYVLRCMCYVHICRFDPRFEANLHNVWLRRHLVAAQRKEERRAEEWERLQRRHNVTPIQ